MNIEQSRAELYNNARRNLPCKNMIGKLLSNLSYNNKDKAFRLNNDVDTDTELLFRGNRLKLSITDPDDSDTIEKAYDFLKDIFVRGELIDRSDLIHKIHGLTKHSMKRPQYRLFTIKNFTNVVGARILEQIPCLDEALLDTGDNILYALYIAVDKNYQGGTGMAKQLYVSSLIDSVIEAEKMGRKFNAIIAECSDSTENLQNSVGLKRVYFKDGIYLTELNFKQPHFNFDPITGRSTENAGQENKEHFMMGLFNKRTINKKDLEKCVRSLFRQYRINKIRIDFENDNAFSEYEKYFDEMERDIFEQIYQSGRLVVLSQKERSVYQLKYGDYSIITHKPEEGLD